MLDPDNGQEALIARLRREAAIRDDELAALHERLDAAEHELEDLRAIRDALTPPELPNRPGLELAAAFLPASAEQVSGDFYLVAEGPQESTVLVVGDVVGHGLQAARRAAFVRTTFAATAPFSDDPARLLSWANSAVVEPECRGVARVRPPQATPRHSGSTTAWSSRRRAGGSRSGYAPTPGAWRVRGRGSPAGEFCSTPTD